MLLAEVERFKGILICLIVLGHNYLFSKWVPEAFGVLYNFHVACFLLLPFLFPSGVMSGNWLKDRLTRYLVPHFFFLGIAAVAYYVIFVHGSQTGAFEWLVSLGLAITFSSETTYDESVGLRLFWFLPALLSLVLIRAQLQRRSKNVIFVLLLISCCVHIFLGALPMHWLGYVPWGLPIVFFLLPVGLVVQELWQRYGNSNIFFFGAIVVGICCVFTGLVWPSSIGLAGEPRVFSYQQPLRLLFHDIYLVAAFFALLGFARVWKWNVLERLGNASLGIFLIHSFVWQALIFIGFVDWLISINLVSVLNILVTLLITLWVSFQINKLIVSSPVIRCLIMPRSFGEWRLKCGYGRNEAR